QSLAHDFHVALEAQARLQGLHEPKLMGRKRDARLGIALHTFSIPVRARFASSGAHRSPRRRTRAGRLSMRKSSIAIPCSTSAQVTGVETAARGVGRTE